MLQLKKCGAPKLRLIRPKTNSRLDFSNDQKVEIEIHCLLIHFYYVTLGKKYKFLTLEERLSIFEHREKNPKDSFEKIARIFSDKLEKNITRVTVYRTYTQIKEEKSKGLQVEESQKSVNRLYSTAVLKFERKLYD